MLPQVISYNVYKKNGGNYSSLMNKRTGEIFKICVRNKIISNGS